MASGSDRKRRHRPGGPSRRLPALSRGPGVAAIALALSCARPESARVPSRELVAPSELRGMPLYFWQSDHDGMHCNASVYSLDRAFETNLAYQLGQAGFVTANEAVYPSKHGASFVLVFEQIACDDDVTVQIQLETADGEVHPIDRRTFPVSSGRIEDGGVGELAFALLHSETLHFYATLVGWKARERPAPGDLVAAVSAPPVEPSVGGLQTGRVDPGAGALVVGIEHYWTVENVPGAQKDARNFATLLVQTMGVKAQNIELLSDSNQINLGRIKKTLRSLARGPNRRVYFYFAGHGATDPERSGRYLMAPESDPGALEDTALSLDWVEDIFDGKEGVAIVDACYSGTGQRSVAPPPGQRLTLRRPRVTVPPHSSRFVRITAAGPDEEAGTGPGGLSGLFTDHLLAGIGHGMADLNGDRDITLAELSHWLPGRVEMAARELERKQTPVITVPAGLDAARFLLGVALDSN
jgi:hypothetical protein